MERSGMAGSAARRTTEAQAVTPATAASPRPVAVLRQIGTRRGALTRAELTDARKLLGNRGMGRLLRQGVQPKLALSPVGDRYEREADRVAELAMGPSVRRAAVHPMHGAGGGVVDPGVAQGIERARSGGSSVPDPVRERMERVSGADFSGVRVHVGGDADRLNEALGSRAFTVGADVFVRRSEYRPGSASGDALLAHELTHTIQQGAAGPSPVLTPAVQRAWYFNNRSREAVWLNDGETSIEPSAVQVLEQLNSGRLGTHFKIIDADAVAGEKVRASQQGWKPFQQAVAPTVTTTTEEEHPKKKQKMVTAVGPPSGLAFDAFAFVGDALLADILRWVVDLRSVMKVPFAENLGQVAKLTAVSKRWYHVVNSYPKFFGYYMPEVDQIVQKYRDADHAAQQKEKVLDAADLRGLQMVTKELARKYPVETYTYVSLGNSPALFVEYFALVHPQAEIVRLPLSGVTGGEVTKPTSEGFQRLKDYVGRTVGTGVRAKLVVIDMAEHGRALAVTKLLLDAYYREKSLEKQVDLFGLTPVIPFAPGEEQPHLEETLKQVDVLRTAPDSVAVKQRLVACHYKSTLLLEIFDKHFAVDIESGTRTEPTLKRGAYQRVRLIVKYAYDVINKKT